MSTLFELRECASHMGVKEKPIPLSQNKDLVPREMSWIENMSL